jgi:hypothetical protein
MLLLIAGVHPMNAWHGGSLLIDETFHKRSFSNLKKVVYYYIIN